MKPVDQGNSYSRKPTLIERLVSTPYRDNVYLENPVDKVVDLVRHNYIIIQKLKSKFVSRRSPEETEKFWQSPDDGSNQPSTYLLVDNKNAYKRSENLASTISLLSVDNPSILEVGCNAGRNLKVLYEHGYSKLQAIEISPDAISFLRSNLPQLKDVPILQGSADCELKNLPDSSVDIVFSMAVLQHIHDKKIHSVTSEMARVASKFIISHECETCLSWRHFPRSYKTLFKKLGYKHLGKVNHMRIFQKM